MKRFMKIFSMVSLILAVIGQTVPLFLPEPSKGDEGETPIVPKKPVVSGLTENPDRSNLDEPNVT